MAQEHVPRQQVWFSKTANGLLATTSSSTSLVSNGPQTYSATTSIDSHSNGGGKAKLGSKTNQNLFGLFKSNEMSHDYLERLFWIDNDLKRLFKTMFTEAFLDNTLFILMGDHGHRFHKIRQTFTGKLEVRLLALHMLIPRNLTERYPLLNGVLEQNSQSEYLIGLKD